MSWYQILFTLQSQVLEILTTNAKYKKGLVAAFKLLFHQDEYEGHSLSGRKNKNGGQRPALGDKRKGSFLEGKVVSLKIIIAV